MRRPAHRVVIALSLAAVVAAAAVVGACMSRKKPPATLPAAPLPEMSAAERELSGRLRGHVEILAGTIGERNVWRYDALERAAAYCEDQLRVIGYGEPGRQVYDVDGKAVRNVEAALVGASRPDEIVIVGAHYDSVRGAPGANDNATGVAAVLEIARLMRDQKPARTVRFVLFVNEEPPFFHTERMGSLVYARRCKARGENVVAMLTPETIGFYADAPGSQHYPPPMDQHYPSTGNFIAFVGNPASKALVDRCAAAFRAATPFPVEAAAAPESLEGVGWSDHWSFWQAGYPGVMATDTAPFRYPHYHTPDDTPDKVDYDRTARVTAGLTAVVRDLAGAGDAPAARPAAP